uniref:(northern house mosquito) hypothetical protein n=1 Tax=Culex pipiens TaxID=7175 RepID=A0A8D8CE69_CULPI
MGESQTLTFHNYQLHAMLTQPCCLNSIKFGQAVSLIEFHNRVGKKSLRFRYLFLSKFSINTSRAPNPYSCPGVWWRWERPAMDGFHGAACPVRVELVLIPFNQFLCNLSWTIITHT